MTTQFFENVIIKFLFTNIEIRDKIFPYLSYKIFDDPSNILIIKKYIDYYKKFQSFPTISEMKLELDDDVFNHLVEIKNLDISEYKNDFILFEIEDFFKKKLIYNIIIEAAENLTKNDLSKISNLPDNLREAIAFSFDTKIGLDIFNEYDKIYEELHNKDKVVSTGITVLDRYIKGGFHEKSLNLFMAETNLGKSLIMCSLATNSLLCNKNVLYITLEMSELKIAERIMSNIFDKDINDICEIDKESFMELFNYWKKRINNKLIIKEFPTKSVNVNHIRNLLKELNVKKKFIPDIIYIDYLSIMLASTSNRNDNTYIEIKRISEEVRGLAVELGIPFVSAVQTNRSGYGQVELDLTQIADSIGTVATADVMIGVTQPDEYRVLNKFIFIILKNRYGLNKKKMSVLVDYFKMRISDDPDDDNIKNIPMSLEKQQNESINEAVKITNNILNKSYNDKFKKIINFE